MKSDEWDDKQDFERTKLAIDCVKHITTLATGTIVFSAAIVEKLPKGSRFTGGLFAASLALVVFSLFLCFFYLFVEGIATRGRNPNHEKMGQVAFGIYLSFGTGLMALGISVALRFFSPK